MHIVDIFSSNPTKLKKYLYINTKMHNRYGYYTCQPVLDGTPSLVRNWKLLLEQSFTAHMALLVATSTFRLRCWV